MRQHGTRSGYSGGCRCNACTVASTREQNMRRLRELNGPLKVPALGAIRRIHALRAIGWPLADIARHLDRTPGTLSSLLYKHRETITRTLHNRIAETYEALSGTPGPSDDVRSRAAREGWAPPLAWDDIDTDPQPTGIRTSDDTSSADLDEWLALVNAGEDGERAARRLGVTTHAISRAARRHGRLDITRRADEARRFTRRTA